VTIEWPEKSKPAEPRFPRKKKIDELRARRDDKGGENRGAAEEKKFVENEINNN
jgi:hypothetical protein